MFRLKKQEIFQTNRQSGIARIAWGIIRAYSPLFLTVRAGCFQVSFSNL